MNSKFVILMLLSAACSQSTTLDAGADAGTDGSRDGSLDSGRTDAPLGCLGETPLCGEWNPERMCCLSTTGGGEAACVEGSWSCESGVLANECGRVQPICGDVLPLFDDCEVTSDCTLTINTCCAGCSIPTAEGFAAVNRELASEYREEVACPEGPVPCPECEAQPNPYLVATCDMTGLRPACGVVDFAVPEYASCETSADCRLQSPACCACGEIPLDQTIAVRGDANLSAVVCDTDRACPPCVPIFSDRLSAACVEGLCQVVSE